MGGFECSTHHHADGRRLDLVASTAHDVHALADYRQLAEHGLRTVRDGVRWHLVEAVRGRYDWSSLDPMLAAARTAGTQVIWDLLHYGWPDWADVWRPDFVARFAAFAGAAAARIGPGGCYVPVNEISFHSWGGGDVGYLDPFAHGRGGDLKRILCSAAILATEAIRAADPYATIIAAEPLISVHPCDSSEQSVAHAAMIDHWQFEACDILLGRRFPELGGSPNHVDVIGVNYYPYNQWWAFDPPLPVPPAGQTPLSTLLKAVSQRYGKPLLIAETGCEGDARAPWLEMIIAESDRAMQAGVDLLGICLYPVLDHPGWTDDRECRNGLLCGFSASPRPVYEPLARVLAHHQQHEDAVPVGYARLDDAA